MKKINLGLKIALILLNFTMLISLAWISSNAFWWIFSPLATDPYANTASINQYDRSIKYINNRAPFGVIVIEKPKIEAVSDNIKLTGIYLNTIKDSIAFLEVNKKPIIAKIGEEIVLGTKIEMIKADRVILNTNWTLQDLPLEKGAAEANSGLNLPSNSHAPNMPTSNYTKETQPDFSPQLQTGSVPQNTDANMEEIRAKRKKIVDEMMMKPETKNGEPQNK